MKIYTEHLHEELFTALSESTESIQIVSPFLTYDTVTTLCNIIAENHVSCTFITRFSLSDMASGANSIEALEQLIMAGVSVYEKEDLHAKIYIIDDKLAFIGSANFTHGGLAKNYEILVSIDKNVEPEQYKRICEYIAPWIEEKYQVLQTHIAKYKPEVKEKKQQVAHTSPQNKEQSPFTHAKREEQREWKVKLAKTKQEPAIWLKIVGRSNDRNLRKEESKKHWGREKIYSKALNGLAIAFGEGINPKAKKGDIIYMVLLSADATGKLDRYFVGKGISKGFNKEQDKGEEFAKEHEGDFGWKWPVYLEIESVQLLADKAMPWQSISLSDLWAYSKRYPENYTPRNGWQKLTPEEAQFLEQHSNLFDEQLLN